MTAPVLAVVHDTGEIVAIGGMGIDLPGRVTPVGIELPEDLSFEDWNGIGEKLQGVERSLMWWIGDWLRFGERRFGEKYAQAIDATDKSYQTLRDAAWVAGAYPNLSDRSDKLTWTHHRFAASLPREARARILKLAENEGLSVRELKSRISQAKSTANLIGAEDPSASTCAISDLWSLVEAGTKFGAIYADPPWLYDNQVTRASTDNHYGGMTVEELCALPIKDLAADSAHLHLWTTNGFLFECPKIFDAWGFEFRSSFVWVKPQIGIGNYWRNSHEFLLTAIRGDAKRFNDHSLKSWMECDRGQHSSKPDQVRSYVEKASFGPYLELFARNTAHGWASWGNQIERTIFNASIIQQVA